MNILCKKTALVFVILMLAEFAAAQASYSVFSPNKQIEVKIHTGDRILYDVLFKGTPLLQKSTCSIDIDHNTLGVSLRVKDTKQRTYDGMLEPAVRQKFAKIRENYNELRLEMEGNYAVVFRAYNEGVAYRFETSLPQNEVKVYDEEASFNFAGDYTAYYPLEESFFSHNERKYLPFKMSEIPTSSIASLPAVVDTANGVKVAVAESDIEDYPGLWLKGTASNGLAATFPHYPLQEVLERDRDYRVTETADYIAVTKGTRTYPWRLLGIAEKDGDLITNQLVWLLEKPSQVQDTSWIKPGKVAWDWWNALNIEGVDFKSGVNTQTYKYYLDFAAKYGLQYIILDEGWYKLGDVLEVVPEINMEELTAYAKQKNVGVILWVVWKSFD
ncbi:MAG: glycoside hydrolase family 97 N-terminal domain-containing protein, partial [Terriglobales bacterium]